MKSLGRNRAATARRRRTVFLLIAASFSMLLVVLTLWLRVAAFEDLNLDLRDKLHSYLSDPVIPSEFILVAIDESSLDLQQTLFPETLDESPTLRAMAQGYPWPRSVYADLLQRLLAAGARAVVFDLLFTGPREGDDALAALVAAHPDRIILAMNFDQSSAHTALQGSEVLSLPAATILPDLASTDPRLGYVNFWADGDEVVRTALYRRTQNGQTYSSLALRAAQPLLEHTPPPPDEPSYFRYADPHSLPVIPFWQIFDPALWRANFQDGAAFRDKIVWVGPTAQRFHDIVNTPDGEIPGPVLHILSATALLRDAIDRPVPPLASALLVALLPFLAATTVWAIPRPFLGLLAILGLCIASWPLAWLLWEYAHLSPDLLYPQAALFFTGLLCLGYDFTLERRERSRTRALLDRYVSRDLVREALDHDATFLDSLDGTRRHVVILFSDIRGFTTWSEHTPPEELVSQLNEYLSEMVSIVFEHEGSVDKFIGDAVMAVWGTIGTATPRENALRATRAALAMHRQLAALNERWRAQSRHELRIGIGLHSGSVIFGNIGSEQKMEPTIIGDTVNVASRVEGLCKKLNSPLILTAPVAEAIRPDFTPIPLTSTAVAGRKAEIEVFTLEGC